VCVLRATTTDKDGRPVIAERRLELVKAPE
jgi:hypothetical protein